MNMVNPCSVLHRSYLWIVKFVMSLRKISPWDSAEKNLVMP